MFLFALPRSYCSTNALLEMELISLCCKCLGSQEQEGIKGWGGEGSLLTGSELPPAQGEPGY